MDSNNKISNSDISNIPAGTPKVSVVVPVYNVEKYLAQCLDFIVAQTLKEIEIICVNDGSTDGSLAILERYAEEDPRIKIINQENRGLSGARNSGMEIATGEFLSFIDSDDWFFTLTALEELYERANKYSLDVLRHRLICFDETKHIFFHRPWDNYAKFVPKGFPTEAFPPSAAFNFFWRIPVTAPGAIYSRKFIEKFHHRFAEGLYFEDQLFFRQVLMTASRAGFLDKPLMVYRKNRAGSITDDWDGSWITYPEIHKRLFEYAQTHIAHEPKLLDSLRRDIINNLSGAYAVRSNIEWKETNAANVRDCIKNVFPQKFLEQKTDEFLGLNPRGKLFVEWVYSGLSYTDFMTKMSNKFKRYKILKNLSFGKRRQHYKNKLSSKF